MHSAVQATQAPLEDSAVQATLTPGIERNFDEELCEFKDLQMTQRQHLDFEFFLRVSSWVVV